LLQPTRHHGGYLISGDIAENAAAWLRLGLGKLVHKIITTIVCIYSRFVFVVEIKSKKYVNERNSIPLIMLLL